MTAFEIIVPVIFLALAIGLVLDARRSAKRLEQKVDRHPAE